MEIKPDQVVDLVGSKTQTSGQYDVMVPNAPESGIVDEHIFHLVGDSFVFDFRVRPKREDKAAFFHELQIMHFAALESMADSGLFNQLFEICKKKQSEETKNGN